MTQRIPFFLGCATEAPALSVLYVTYGTLGKSFSVLTQIMPSLS